MTLDDHADRIAAVAARAQVIFKEEAIRAGSIAVGGAKLNATSRLRVRTGRLRNSMAMGVEQVGGTTTLTLSAGGPEVKYAKAQDLGATIRPRGRLLAMPIGDGLTPAGVARYASPRDVPGGFWMKSRAGNPIFARATGKEGKGGLEILFVGLRQVVIPASHFMTDPMRTASETLPVAIRARMASMLKGAA